MNRFEAPVNRFALLFAGLRDIALVVFGIVYILGSITFAMYSIQLNVGDVIGSAASYFVLGLMLVLPIITCFALPYLGYTFYRRYINIDTFSRTAIMLMMCPIVIAWVLSEMPGVVVEGEYFSMRVLYAGTLILALLWLAAINLFNSELRAQYRILYAVFASFFPFATTFFAATLIMLAIPYLPQELGGLRPKCAQMDIHPGELSQKTRWYLSMTSNDVVVSTERLEVLFTRLEVLFTRCRNGPAAGA